LIVIYGKNLDLECQISDVGLHKTEPIVYMMRILIKLVFSCIVYHV